MNIIDVFDDQRLIGGYIQEQQDSFFNWKVFIKSIYAIPMDRREKRIFKKFTGGRRPPRKPIESVYCISGRKSGKSLIASCLAIYTTIFEDFWKPYLRPGQKVLFPIIATDKVQAREVFQYCDGILNSNPIFRAEVSRSLTWEIELNNSAIIMIRTANFKAVRGPLYAGAILDEVAFMRDENSVNPAGELIKGILPGLIPGAKLIGISSVYAKFGVLYEEHKEYFGKDNPDTMIWLSDTMSMNPFFDERKIIRALKKDYSHAMAEYYSVFREDIESYIPPELVDEMMVPGRFLISKKPATDYFAFLDPSGGRQDSFTLGISHRGRNKIILDVLEEKVPPFKPKRVAKEYAKIMKRYGITTAKADHYAEAWVQEAFEDYGIEIEYSDLTASELYLNFLPMLSNGEVELLDNKRLKAQLVGLERKTRSGGKDLVTHYPGGHDDLANVCAGSVVAASMQEDMGEEFAYHGGMEGFSDSAEKNKALRALQSDKLQAAKGKGSGRSRGESRKPVEKPWSRVPLSDSRKRKKSESSDMESWVI